MTMQQRPPRVQSVLRGPTEASCLQQAISDGERAAQNGYVPIAQSWSRDASGITLTVLYELTSPAPAQWSQPTTANAWTPPAQPQPTQTGWMAPTPQPVGAQPAQPAPTGWSGPASQPTQPQPAWQAQRPEPMQRPPVSRPQQTLNGRAWGAIASIVAFIIAFLVYSALNRALY